MPQVKCKSFDDLIDCLETDYTLTVRDICEKLKITRPTFDTAIKPHIHYVKIGGYVRIDDQNYERSKWNLILNKMEVIQGYDQTYYNKQEFENLIYCHTRFTQQTKKVELTDYIKNETKLENYYMYTKQANAKLSELKDTHKLEIKLALAPIIQELHKMAEHSLYEAMTKNGKRILDTAPNPTKRTLSPAVEVKIPKDIFLQADWQSVSEIAGWGGTSEQAMREIFMDSKIRCEIVLLNKKGKETKIVRYMDDPFAIGDDYSSNSIRRLASCQTLVQYKIKVRLK